MEGEWAVLRWDEPIWRLGGAEIADADGGDHRRGDGARRSLSVLLPALRSEITLLSPAAMPFMPQQRDSNVSTEEGALLWSHQGAQTAPAHPVLMK